MTLSLCLPAASFLTGAVIPVDGGLMATECLSAAPSSLPGLTRQSTSRNAFEALRMPGSAPGMTDVHASAWKR